MTPERERQLAIALSNYTDSYSDSYDPEFAAQIREEAPDWFNPSPDPNGNKEQLLEIARNGENRPKQGKHPLGKVLSKYTIKSSSSYDPDFDTKVRQLAPHWFINTANAKKEQLLEMARNGEAKPYLKKHPLGQALVNYTSKSDNAYDQDFDTKIRELIPDWFDKTYRKKQQLLEMAKNGEDRPSSRKHPLGNVLANYTKKSSGSYDPDFDKKIRRIAPHWFN